MHHELLQLDDFPTKKGRFIAVTGVKSFRITNPNQPLFVPSCSQKNDSKGNC